MNEYFTTFLEIATTAEQMLNHEYNSLEIKSSATILNGSVQSCLEELKQSATRLKCLVQVCLDDLDGAEEVWNNKPKIVQKASLEIWEQIGEVSGSEIRIRQAGSQYRDEAIKQAQEFWDNLIKDLKKKWFIDAKGQLKKGVGWNEKTGALNDIRTLVERQSMELNRIVKDQLSFLSNQIIGLDSIQEWINNLNCYYRKGWQERLSNKIIDFQTNFSKERGQDFYSSTSSLRSELGKNWGDLLWEDITKFQKIGHKK